MAKRFGAWLGLGGLLLLLMGAASEPTVVLLDLEGPIGPASSDYFTRGLAAAAQQRARLVVVRLDTPGGLDSAMRGMIKALIASPVPVAVYVAPGGARAASAGTYLLYAAHFAAMAPGTNLGAATPVRILGGDTPGKPAKAPREDAKKPSPDAAPAAPDKGAGAMQQKVVNDAVAYIRSLAQLRGRNAEWAEQAVRQAASLPAHEALHKGVIDIVAQDLADLLRQLQGRSVKLGGGTRTLDVAGAEVQRVVPDWRSRLLAVITDPNVAYILLLIGFYGLFFEFANPGYVLPGVAGAIALLLALYAFQVLPVNYAGLGLILLGLLFMLGEALVPSFGVLGIGGIIAFVIGSVVLMDSEAEFYAISTPLIAAVAALSAAFCIGLLGMLYKARHRPVVSGRATLLHRRAEVVEDFSGRGRVTLDGEIWWAETDGALRKGDIVEIVDVDDLTLKVVIQQEV